MAHMFTPSRLEGNLAAREANKEQSHTIEATSPIRTAFHANTSLSYIASSDDHICARCRSLGRTSFSGPPFPLATPSFQFPDASNDLQPTLHEFLRDSLRPSCRICSQLLQLLDIRGQQPDRLRIWWNQYRAAPSGSYVHSCRIDDPKGYHEEFSLVDVRVGAMGGNDSGRSGNGPDYAGIKRWLRYCRENHTRCAITPQQTTSGLRVIDCKARALATIPPSHPYVALSYVWGIAGSEDHPALYLPPTLPRTIEDAMEVTLELGVGYLWVDRYCINQDDEEEKKRLFAMMDVIYRNAELTIIAAAGEGPEAGLPGIRQGSAMLKETLQIGTHSLYVVPLHHSELRRVKWNTRGWTYQEARLSIRRLLFLPSQLALQCPSSIHLPALHPPLSESAISLIPTHTSSSYSTLAPFRHPTPAHSLSLPWSLRADLYAYYERDLSFPTDILNAFQGIVNSYAHHRDLQGTLAHFWGVHIFALPHLPAKTAFIADLAWCVVSRSGYFFRAATALPADHAHEFPSWSWASKMAHETKIPPSTTPRTALRHKERDDRDPFDAGTTRLVLAHDITIAFTHATSGKQVTVEDFVRLRHSYLSFRPSFSITTWIVRGNIRSGIPLDRHEPFREEGVGGGYEELDLDYCVEWARGEGSVVVVFLGAWEGVGSRGEDEYEGSEEGCCDVCCLLCEEVAPEMVRRFGLWSASVEKGLREKGVRVFLDALLRMRVLEAGVQWERREIRLV